jgi:hypothetical protein
LDSVLTAGPDPRGRSRITNKVRASPLGLDGRSERGRRWRDIIDGLIREYGPSEVDKLRELATLKLSLEATQAAVINGDILRSEDLIRLANAIGRCEKPLRARVRARAAQAPAGASQSEPDLSHLSNEQLDRLGAMLAEADARKAAEANAARDASEARRMDEMAASDAPSPSEGQANG